MRATRAKQPYLGVVPGELVRQTGGRNRRSQRRPEVEEPEPGRLASEISLEATVKEWLLDLRIRGRSPRSIEWYEGQMRGFVRYSMARTLADLDIERARAYMGHRQESGLSENSIHADYQTIKAFANWCANEELPVSPTLSRLRAPKVSIKELVTYTDDQVKQLLDIAPKGWPLLALQIMMGTGMRVAELRALEVDDFEDDGEASFLKIRRGKGAKFRRAPVSDRLRRELHRYVNRVRPKSADGHLLLQRGGQPLTAAALESMFRRLRLRLGFHVHAHGLRHTFATEYLRRGGDIERLRRILGHSSYAMVMRYVHLNKEDLSKDFSARALF